MSNIRKRATQLTDAVSAALKKIAKTGISSASPTKYFSTTTGREVTEACAKRNPLKAFTGVNQLPKNAKLEKDVENRSYVVESADNNVAVCRVVNTKKTSRSKTTARKAKKLKAKARYVYICTLTGKFVSASYAESNPHVTIRRKVKPKTTTRDILVQGESKNYRLPKSEHI